MEVCRFGRWAMLVAVSCLGAACAKKVDSEKINQLFPPNESLKCDNTAIKTKFVVTWLDGHISVETAKDREEFIQNTLIPHQDKIAFVEYDQKVQSIAPSEVKAEGVLNWGTAKVKASAAWSRGATGEGVIVAVIDSGVDISHPQLATQIYTNEAEANGLPQVDDDGNGYVDDIHGWNFVDNAPLTKDNQSHGTHVAGIIAANPNAGPVQGMAPNARILPLAFLASNGSGDVGDAISAIQYAVQMKAKVINASWGGAACSTTLRNLIQSLAYEGVLFMAAAGNERTNIDIYPSFPASFAQLNFAAQITVGASTNIDYQASFSNEGIKSVHLLAPGMDIISTIPNGKTASYDGTSMATPFVSGAAALLWSAFPHALPVDIKAAILAGVDRGDYYVMTGGRMNVEKSLAYLDKLATLTPQP